MSHGGTFEAGDETVDHSVSRAYIPQIQVFILFFVVKIPRVSSIPNLLTPNETQEIIFLFQIVTEL